MKLPRWDESRDRSRIETKFHLHTQSRAFGTGVEALLDWALTRFAPQTQNARRGARYMQDKHHPGGRREVSFLNSILHTFPADGISCKPTPPENSIPSVPTPARVILQHVGAACAAWLPCDVPCVAAASPCARGARCISDRSSLLRGARLGGPTQSCGNLAAHGNPGGAEGDAVVPPLHSK